MAFEIERKFLVTSQDFKDMATHSEAIEQGYLNREPERTVRVRVLGDKGYITVKSKNSGAVRHEWEYEIPVSDAREMLANCLGLIVKRRWYVPYAGHVWEVDEFGGRHEGLVVAEIELSDESETFDRPAFVGMEVTGDPRYYNSTLAGKV